VIPATGANARAVAEYVIALAMVLLRGAYGASADVAAGRWPRAALGDGRETSGKTLGVVGFGSIGRTTARLARAIGMRVVGTDSQVPADAAVWQDEQTEPRALDELLAESDVVTLHVPLLAETRNLIDARRLSRMKEDAILIDTARGGIVDEAALLDALAAGRLGGAALDVFADEPLPANDRMVEAVRTIPNLVLTPHIAGMTREANDRVSTLIAERVAAFLSR
jgi:(S)-sulfolactate dehydrogenase